MAQEKQTKPVDTEKYKGPGKVLSTVSGTVSGFLTGVTASAVVGGGMMLSALKNPEKIMEMVQKNSTGTRGIAMKALGWWGLLIVPTFVGGWMGFSGASKGKHQFEVAKNERDEARGQLGQAGQIFQGLQAENQALAQENMRCTPK
jgi:hypothetical protein